MHYFDISRALADTASQRRATTPGRLKPDLHMAAHSTWQHLQRGGS